MQSGRVMVDICELKISATDNFIWKRRASSTRKLCLRLALLFVCCLFIFVGIKHADAEDAVTSLESATDKPSACRDGYLSSPRTEFWKYNQGGPDGPVQPGLSDVVALEGQVYALLNLRILKQRSTRALWASARWSFSFEVGLDGNNDHLPTMPGDQRVDSSNSTVLVVEAKSRGRIHTLVVSAQLPQVLANHSSETPLFVSISCNFRGHVYTYHHVPFCLYPEQPNTPPKYKLVACTSVTTSFVTHLMLLPEWLAYHQLQGFEHFYIYVNSPPYLVRMLLAPLMRSGVVTLVDWMFPPEYANTFVYQHAQQNACLLRARGVAEWIALNDVDEFYQPRQPGMTVSDYLKSLSSNPKVDLSKIGALQIDTWWFGSAANQNISVGTFDNCRLVTATYQHCDKGPVKWERQKLIANPQIARMVNIHELSQGGKTYMVDAMLEMRAVHYKLPHQRSYPFKDDSMQQFAGALRARLAPWCVQS